MLESQEVRKVKKDVILAEIKRTAETNGGVPLGFGRFTKETGIKESEWLGKHWARWGDALVEAGFKPNLFRKAHDEVHLLDKVSSLVLKLGRVPVQGEMQMERSRDQAFPPVTVLYKRYEGMLGLTKRLVEYCALNPELAQAVIHCQRYLDEHADDELGADEDEEDGEVELGYVYLVRSGKHYKIGRSNSAGRREREIALQLPEKAKVSHVISTDDPVGIEAYWHKRFDDKRCNGEWFELSAADVSAFKRRKFM